MLGNSCCSYTYETESLAITYHEAHHDHIIVWLLYSHRTESKWSFGLEIPTQPITTDKDRIICNDKTSATLPGTICTQVLLLFLLFWGKGFVGQTQFIFAIFKCQSTEMLWMDDTRWKGRAWSLIKSLFFKTEKNSSRLYK